MKDVAPRPCSIADALEVVGERWSLLAVRELFYGVRRFDQIARNTGASRDILAARLRKLEAAGVIERRPYSERPVRYEYHLTAAGRDLGEVLAVLAKWGDKHLAGGDPPVRWHHSCGELLDPVVVCAACGKPAIPGAHTPIGRGVVGY